MEFIDPEGKSAANGVAEAYAQITEIPEQCPDFPTREGLPERVCLAIVDPDPFGLPPLPMPEELAAALSEEAEATEMSVPAVLLQDEERRPEPDMKGVSVVEHHDELTAGDKDTVDLRYGFLNVGCVVKNPEGVHHVEMCSRKWERFGIGNEEGPGSALQCKTLLSKGDALRAEVNPGYLSPVAGKL